jgi:N-methylhydantoinase A
MHLYIGTDVGGTFTDLWVADDSGRSQVFKSPTTPDVIGGVIGAARLAADAYGLPFERFCAAIEKFGHGTTVGLNALLTGRAARTAIVTTLGFGDTLEIGRVRRQTSGLSENEVTDFFKHDRFKPLVPRELVVEVSERIDVKGTVLIPIDEAEARAALRSLAGKGVEAIAVCTLWSTLNPVHELRLRELVKEELGELFVSLSHQISPVVGEYGRMSTTAANAALGPIAGRYLLKLEETLKGHGMRVPILMMTNSGGVLPTAVLNDRPAYSLFSGPAAGVIGSLALSEKLEAPNVLTTDIGGTSFDVGVIVAGKPIRRSEISVAGADIRLPSIDVASIGAGGGSIASVEFGDLTVGPQSAGANPGPACYGRGGTRATATDADLVLGVLDPDHFLGGHMRLDLKAAREAIERDVARPLEMSIEEAAWGIREILDNRMADLLRRVTIERGHDPGEFTLLANGGAGPSHAWVLARELGLSRFVVPAAATGQSAYGCANSDLGLADDRPVYLRVKPGGEPAAEQLARIDEAVCDSRSAVTAGLRAAGAQGEIAVEQSAAVRYRGQTNTLDIEIGGAGFDRAGYDTLVATFERRYESLFGRGSSFTQAGFEVLAIRTIGHGILKPPKVETRGDRLVPTGARKVIFDDPARPVEARIYRIAFPRAHEEARGPCIIEYPGQSVVVPPGAVARADALGNLHMVLNASEARS